MRKRRFFYDTEFIEYPCFIDIISIGIVGEDGSTFYGINRECNFSRASDWVQENVVSQLPKDEGGYGPWLDKSSLAHEILVWLRPSKKDPIELWGYYGDYDHVALCWLFGPMIDLPKGMPMYTYDIKQLAMSLGNPELPKQEKGEHNALEDAKWNKLAFDFLQKRAHDMGVDLAHIR